MGAVGPVFPWLPARARPLGLALAIAGAVLGHAVLGRGFRPKALDLPVFAIRAQYFEARSFVVIEKNVALELAVLLVVLGLFGVAFSRDVVETAESEAVRVRSLVWAVCLGTILMSIATVSLYGVVFVYALAAHVVVILALASGIGALLRARRALARTAPFAPRRPT